MTDQHDGATHVVARHRDVLEQPHVDGIGQIGMEVEQHVNAGCLDCTDVFQHRRGFGIVQLRFHVDVDAPQAFGHGPPKQRPRRTTERTPHDVTQQAQEATFVESLHDDDGHARAQDHLEIVEVVHRPDI